MDKPSNNGDEEQSDVAPGSQAAQRIFQTTLENHLNEEKEKKQEEEAAARVHAQMTGTATKIRNDPFGIDVSENKPFDSSSYDVSE